MKFTLFVFMACVQTFYTYADYLVTNRKTSVKTEASSSSSVLMQVEINVTLILLDETQTNGYYRVKGEMLPSEGWIYRTFVRRYAGEPPAGSSVVEEDAEVRVLDVGAGQCNLIKLPGKKYVIYDAGHWQNYGKRTLAQVTEYIEPGSTIELLVLSHTDADHIGAAENIIRNYIVKKVLWTGYERSMISTSASTDAFKRLVAVLTNPPYPIENINLNARDSTITPGSKISFGDASFTFLCGFGKPESDWLLKSDAERLNAVSIMMKLEYKGQSVLFTGDAVGRHIGDVSTAVIATEKYVVEKASSFLQSTVVIAPHHGADNGSSTTFIQAVKPRFVIFSSGHMYQHPAKAAAERYLANGVDIWNMYRTDRGDDEFTSNKPYNEWAHLQVQGCSDPYGDDDVNIVLPITGSSPIVSYLTPTEGCMANQ